MKTTKDAPPTESEVQAILGSAYAAYTALLARAPEIREWKRYSKTAQWALKTGDKAGTLFYVQVSPGAVQVTVGIGNRAAEAVLAGSPPVTDSVREAILVAKSYVEGRPVRIEVRDVADLAAVDELLAIKRPPKPTSSRSSRERPRSTSANPSGRTIRPRKSPATR